MLALGIAIVWSIQYKLNEYAITPGLSQPVGPLITVTDHPHAPVRKTIYLTDVYLTQLNVWQWLYDELHPVHVELIPGSDLTGGDVPTSQLVAQGYLEMYDSQNSAKAVGMRAVGYRVTGTPAGVTVTAVGTRAPAAHVLSVADRIVGARGRPVRSVCGLVAAMRGARPGTAVPLRVERATITSSGTITYAAATTVVAPTGAPPAGDVATGCPGSPTVTAVLGTGIEDATDWHFPVKVSIDTAFIGGPSAGLAMTLGVIDALSKVSITGGTKVAATGTISANGTVGDVGGVAEKTIAVESAGATVFLVPTVEYTVAKKAASPSLKVVPVRTLRQALAAIEAAGGRPPAPIADASGAGATS
ncbi:MAG TPA: S16 family serine protease [Acidimicrobiales bacterium]|nr:S16 family serine protease [Acidimicrobiales bacterium]